MKKLIAVLIVFTIPFAFVACNNSNETTSNNTSVTVSSTSSSVQETTEELTQTVTSATTEKPTEMPTEKPTEKPTAQETKAEQTVHSHSWENITTKIHHDAVTTEEWVVDEPAKNIPFEIREYWCQYCSRRWSYDSLKNNESDLNRMLSDMDNHLTDCIKRWKADEYRMEFNYPKINVTTVSDTVRIDEKGHYETKTIKEAYDEEKIVGKRCRDCGETIMN